jgi:hypothetical protein
MGSGLTILLDPRYAYGHCLGCRKQQTFIRYDEPEGGQALKAEGMAKASLSAGQGSDAAWKIEARAAALALAATGAEFTQDDITDRVGLPTIRNATGSLLSGLARSGKIVRLGDTNGKRDSQHSRRISVWRGA